MKTLKLPICDTNKNKKIIWRKDESHTCNSNNNWWNNIADVLSNHDKTIHQQKQAK
ncbi:MAG: hypothetical protein WA120_02980 [Candidatus Hydromicrobium sp.]